jgi:peptidoglycan/LPS O-acetylase OafA/YrhL
MLVVNGINIVQSFFVIGSFLTGYLFFVHVEQDKSSGWLLFLKAVILRYIRFAPLLLLTILMHSTWLYRVGSGPLWDKVNFAERQFCRQNWWINMLFLDNYVNVEEKCLIHTWYLAADFWLSALATFCLILIQK